MNCKHAQRCLPGYLDGAIPTRDHARVREHIESCGECRHLLEGYRRLVVALANVEPVQPPANLATSIRVSAAQTYSPRQAIRKMWARAAMVFEDVLEPLAVPATGGVITALVVFALVVQNILVGVPMGGVVPNDLPLNLVQPARLESLAPFPVPVVIATDDRPGSGLLLVEATLNAHGQVVSYKILSGPSDDAAQHQLDQLLLFSRFRPQTNFGLPRDGGRVVLNFSAVRVRG
ncbi:MAG: zf-HC2 domain-containing protein [Candidatus Acidiferrales bacterium]